EDIHRHLSQRTTQSPPFLLLFFASSSSSSSSTSCSSIYPITDPQQKRRIMNHHQFTTTPIWKSSTEVDAMMQHVTRQPRKIITSKLFDIIVKSVYKKTWFFLFCCCVL
ncbi:hypothetical protein C5167_007499, partial [Papaver somniferum]